MLTEQGTLSLYRMESFPVEVRVLDGDGEVLLTSWHVATPRLAHSESLVIEYDTDVTYYHKKNKPVVVRLEIYRDGKLFATHSLDSLIYKGTTVNFSSAKTPRPHA